MEIEQIRQLVEIQGPLTPEMIRALKRVKTKECKWHECGVVFIPSQKKQKFCSRAHSIKFYNWKRYR